MLITMSKNEKKTIYPIKGIPKRKEIRSAP